VKVANNLFKQIVRDAKYDFAELAIVTICRPRRRQALHSAAGVLVSRGQHHTIAYERSADRSSLPTSRASGLACAPTR